MTDTLIPAGRNPAGPTRRLLLLSGAAVLLAGCAGNIIGPPPAPQLYVMQPDFGAVADAPAANWQLVVALPDAPDSLDTARIALINAPNTMDYYANAQWTDRLPSLLQSLTVQAFQSSGKMKAVGRDTEGLSPDYVLGLDIRDFEAYYAAPDTPPRIDVKIVANLMNPLSHVVVATLRSDHSAQASANNMASITQAFTEATGAAVKEIVNWTLHAPPPKGLGQSADATPPQPPVQRPPRHRR
ncbi:MAG TPA: ABC-type transport auxiliary lipoprotein family protein [Rhizomicrobium sp.]|jgi:cholesterol transport system auxiliary component